MIGRRKNVPGQNIADTFPDVTELPFVSPENNFGNEAQQNITASLQKKPQMKKKPGLLGSFSLTIARLILSKEFIENANKENKEKK